MAIALKHWIVGEGRPLLIIHGGPGLDHSYLRPWLDRLANRRQLVFADLRASGLSDAGPDDEFTWENMVGDLEALRKSIGVEKWTVLGHSGGGLVAQTYALGNPDSVERLVLVNTSSAPDRIVPAVFALAAGSPAMTRQMQAAIERLGQSLTDDIWKQTFQTLLPLYFHNYPVKEILDADKIRYREKFRLEGFAMISAFDLRDRIGKISAPTLVMVGRHDAILPVSHSEELQKSIPRADLIILEQSGHFPFIEENEGFLKAAEAFLV